MTKTLWGEHVKLDGSHFKDHLAIALFVITLVVFIGLLLIYCFMHKRHKYVGEDALLRRRAFSRLGLSLVVLLLYYTLRIISLILAETQILVTGAYFLLYILMYGFLNLANVYAIAIVCRISHYQFGYMGQGALMSRVWRLVSSCLATALVALGLYSFAMYATAWVLKFQNISGDVPGKFSTLQIKLDAAFGILYLVTVVFLATFSFFYCICQTKLREKPTIIEFHFLAVIFFLLIRSAADTHIAVQYGLYGHTAPKYLRVVEEAFYGLPSVVIYYSLERLSLPVTASVLCSVVRSKLLRKGREIIRKEFARRRMDAANGGPALPTRAEILEEIEHRPLAYLPASVQSSMSGWSPADIQITLSMHFDDLLAQCEKI